MSNRRIDILVLISNPNETQKLQLEHELKHIKKSINLSKYRDHFHVTSHSAVTPEDFRRALLTRPQIIHFSGHGLGDNGILLENEIGNIQLVETESICKLFKIFSDTTYCVILNACYTDVQGKLMSEYVPYIIGMKSGINDNSSINFSAAFYDALGSGESIELAYELGCNAIHMMGLSGSDIPSLHYNERLSKKNEHLMSPPSQLSSSSQISYLASLNEYYLQEDLNCLNERLERLSNKRAFFQKEKDIKLSSDVQFQLTHQIAEITQEINIVRANIQEIKDRLGK